MAKVNFGGAVSEMRNKLGDQVFARNAHGAFSRNYITPPYRDTARTRQVRADFSELTKAWSSALTDNQRQGWRTFSDRFMQSDVFGQARARGGSQSFLKVNALLRSVGAPDLLDAPGDQSVDSPGDVFVDESTLASGRLDISVRDTPGLTQATQIWATPPLNSGEFFFFDRLRLIATEGPGWGGFGNYATAYAARGFDLSSAAAIAVAVRYVRLSNGAASMRLTRRVLGPGGSELLVKRAVFNDAQIKHMPTVPLPLIPAPGVGKIIVPLQLVCITRFSAGAYGSIDAGNFIRLDVPAQDYGSSSYISNDATAGFTNATSFLGATDGFWQAMVPPGQVGSLSPGHNYQASDRGGGFLDFDNAPLSLWSDNSVDYTGGDPGNSLVVIVPYFIVGD